MGEIPHTAGVHGVAIAPELSRGFISNGKAATATVFDLKTLQVIGEVKTGSDPDAIVYEPMSKKVFTFNGNSNSATVFDAKTSKVLGTIALGVSKSSALIEDARRDWCALVGSEKDIIDPSSTPGNIKLGDPIP